METRSMQPTRAWIYGALPLLLMIPYLLFQNSSWQGSAELHTIMEVIAALSAFAVGSLALILFYSKKKPIYLLIGAGFFGTSLLDGYHALVTSSFYYVLLPSPSPQLIPWSWNASRLFLSLFMCLSWWVSYWKQREFDRPLLTEFRVYLAGVAMASACIVLFTFVPMPKAYYLNNVFGRPEEFVAAFFFAIALIGYLKKGGWKKERLEHWIVLSLITGLFSQGVVMARSHLLFDAMFDLAHLLKIASYFCLYVGFSINMFHLFQRAETSSQELRMLNEALENRVAKRTERLDRSNRELHENQKYIKNIISSMINSLIVVSPAGKIVTVNAATCTLLDYREEDLLGQPARLLFVDEGREAEAVEQKGNFPESLSDKGTDPLMALPLEREKLQALITLGHISDIECYYRAKGGGKIPVLFSGSVMRDGKHAIQGIVCVAQDNSERKQLQFDLSQAQRLESVGQLAAGIAHEINTPTQYVGDNTRFLEDAFVDISAILESLNKLLEVANQGDVDDQIIAEVKKTLQEADVEYLNAEIPQAIGQSLDGIERVAKIVRAMKDFSHPGDDEKSLVNLRESLETTLSVSRNEWKYVANIKTEFDPDLPEVYCLPGDLNQVFLNLIVNAAHAIDDFMGESAPEKGTITVGTRQADDGVEVFIRDTGGGIPEEIQLRIFDPFFTTKEVGKGTGQGLAIARSVVVDKHGGSLDYETEQGKGTTFRVKLPLHANSV